MRVLLALVAFAIVTALNLLWWWVPNRPVEIAGWTNAPLQSVSFAPYRPGQSPLTRTFPTTEQIDQDLKRLQGKVRAVRTYSAGENLEAVPQLAGKYGLKVWHGAWLNDNDKENLEQINLLIDHANRYPDTIERVIVGNEVLLRRDLTANQLRGYIRQVKSRVKQPVTYADVWEFWLRNPQLADEVDFITIHLLPYWEDEPIGLDRREADGSLRIENHIKAIYKRVQDRFPGKKIVIGETGWPSDGRMRSDARPGRVEQVRYFSIFRALAEKEHFDYNIVEAFDQQWKARQEGTVGAAWGLLDAWRHDKFQLGQPVSAEPHWRMLFALSSLLTALLMLAFASWRRKPPARSIAIFALFAQMVATAYVQSVWIDLSRTFYFEKMMGVAFWAILLGAFSYALLRGIADSLTRRMADASLYGARVREVLAGVARAAALPHPAARRPDAADALSRADGALHLLPDRHHHRLVRRRHPLGRHLLPPDLHRRPLPRLPDLELRHPEPRADGVEDHDRAAQGEGRAARADHAGALVRPPAGLRRQTRLCAHDQVVQPDAADPAGDRAVVDADPVGDRDGDHRGRDQALRRRRGRLRRRPTAGAG